MVKVKNKLIVALITLLAVILASSVFVIKNQTNTESNSLTTKVSADTKYTQGDGLYKSDGTFVSATNYFHRVFTSGVASIQVDSSYLSQSGEVYLNDYNMTAITSLGGMFSNCSGLTSITFGSDFNTSNVTSMSSMFSDCSALTSITFGSNFNTSKVTSMFGMFSGCGTLKSLDLSNFDTTNVTNMNDMFSGCRVLKSLDLSSFDLSKLTSYSSMFYNCFSLTQIKGPKNIGSLTNKISLPSGRTLYANGEVVTKLQQGVTMTTDPDYRDPVAATLPSDWQSKVGVSGITSIKFGTTSEVSDYTDSNKTIDSDIKVYVKNTTDIALVNDAGIVAPSDCSDLFSISSLKTIDLTNLDMSSVTSTNNMLAGCENLTSITAPSKLASGQSIILPTSSNKTWKNASGENITSLTTGTVTAETISTPDVPSTGVVSTSASILATVLVVAMLGYAISKKRKKA